MSITTDEAKYALSELKDMRDRLDQLIGSAGAVLDAESTDSERGVVNYDAEVIIRVSVRGTTRFTAPDENDVREYVEGSDMYRKISSILFADEVVEGDPEVTDASFDITELHVR